MKFDIFLSLIQNPVDGVTPSEKQVYQNFFDQVFLADELGMETAWIAETHLSCQVQKKNPWAVIPHFQGEIGLNTDVLQMAHLIFHKTRQINVGSAIRNIICNGGPIAHAEAVKTFLSLHSQFHGTDRQLELGFAAGRFPFSNRAYGIEPRDSVEEAAWPALRGKIFMEATEIFLRLLKEKELSSEQVSATTLTRADFRSDEDWHKVVRAWTEKQKTANTSGSVACTEPSGAPVQSIPVKNRWPFAPVGVIPYDAPLEYLKLTIGAHWAGAQSHANQFMPVGVFNLSITPPEVIEKTHHRMAQTFHKDGGDWTRSHMPRTILVFVEDEASRSVEENRRIAREKAIKANETYWRAIQGTLDPRRIEAAVDNALVGTPEDIIEQMKKRFHPDDRLMLWFDLNCHDNQWIKKSMKTFMEKVAPNF